MIQAGERFLALAREKTWVELDILANGCHGYGRGPLEWKKGAS